MNQWLENTDLKLKDHDKVLPAKTKFNEDSAQALALIKRKIVEMRGSSYPTESIKNVLVRENLKSVSSIIADAFLYGQKILVVGRSNSDHVLSIVTFIRSMRLLSQAMQRTRDVVETSRGSLGDWTGQFEIDYSLIYTRLIEDRKPFEDIEQTIKSNLPDIVLVLDPVKGLLDSINSLDQVPKSHIISLLTTAPAEKTELHGYTLHPDLEILDKFNEQKPLTLTPLVYELCTHCRKHAIEKVVKHPRSQALMAQLQSACLESTEGFVALSLLLDDMPMRPLARQLVKRGIEQINRGAVLQPRTAHSKGVLSYGLRSLLEECELTLPVTAQSLQFGLTPLFSALCYAGSAEILIDCLLSNERKVASDKSAKASIIKARTYFPSLKHLASLMTGEQKKDQLDNAKSGQDLEYVVHRVEEENPKYIPVFAEQKHAERGITQIVVSASRHKNIRCFIRSDLFNVNDVLRACSYYLAVPSTELWFWADAFSGDVSIPEKYFSDLERFISNCIAQGREYSQLKDTKIDDGALSVNQRTSALALWLERQPWGREYPEPLFKQAFIVKSSSTLMESHQEITVQDITEDGKSSHGEAFHLLWRNSVDTDKGRVRPGSLVEVEYRLKLRRGRNTSEVYGEILKLSLIPNDPDGGIQM